MTEKQWLAGTDGVAMAEYWGKRFTDRKARLLMLACCRRHPTYLRHAVLRAAVKAIADYFADPVAEDTPMDGEHFRELYNRVDENASARSKYPGRGVAFGVLAAVEPASVARELQESRSYLIFSSLTDIANGFSRKNGNPESAAQAVLVREILGNPFKRPKPKIKPAWRTDTVLALARQIYSAEDFGAMPILADALQDAGCDNDELLNHCRDTKQVHVRGCWVLDLLLNKK
jgi:hypothetical protein